MGRLSILLTLLVVAGCSPESAIEPGFALETSDGRQVAADVHADTMLGLNPLVLLFHQADSNGLSEYERILPRLRAQGYDAITADLRLGGSIFGGVNRTMLPADSSATYCDVYPDLEAVLNYAREQAPDVRPVLWGSSYSAALALQLAARRQPDVAGVVAFSPASGQSMEGCRPEPYTDSLATPALIVRPANESAVPSVSNQIGVFIAQGNRVFIAQPGRHGASTMDEERVGASVDDTWEFVLRYMNTLAVSEGDTEPEQADESGTQ